MLVNISNSLPMRFTPRCLRSSVVKLSRNSHVTRATQDTASSFEIESNYKTLGPVAGMYAQVEHAFYQESVTTFAGLCGDNNPLHIDPVFAASTMFKGPIVHGILVSSLFSALFGRTVHGSIYVSQNLKFKRPVMVGAAVIARMEVIESKPTSKGAMLSCKTLVYLKEGNKAISELKTAVEGDAVVLVPSKA